MKVQEFPLQPPQLQEVAEVLQSALKANFEHASVTVETCPDLRQEPFGLAAEGLSGDESIADIGGQPNLFPIPKLDARYSLLDMAGHMKLLGSSGMLIGAGAGPFYDIGVNNELAPNVSWSEPTDGSTPRVTNMTHYARIVPDGSVMCTKSPTTNCALMMNLYGSRGLRGPVLKISARKRLGGRSFTDCIRFGLHDHYGSETPISIGGAFLLKRGCAKFHVMPDFPSEERLPFKDPKQLNDWLTYHEFDAPIVCLTVMHTADPIETAGEKLGLRMEHTHCFTTDGSNRGGHLHHDIQGMDVEEVEYEAYLNTAKVLYRIDQPQTTLESDLHD